MSRLNKTRYEEKCCITWYNKFGIKGLILYSILVLWYIFYSKKLTYLQFLDINNNEDAHCYAKCIFQESGVVSQLFLIM